MRFYDYLTEFVFVQDEPQAADYLFIPGSAYGELAQKAAQLYHQGFAKKIVVSGKYSILKGRFEGPSSPPEYRGREYASECDFLCGVLLAQNVAREDILRETQATYTYENAIFTRRLLKDERVEKAILVCQAYHARRCLLYYSQLFPETEFFVCPAATRGITRENWHRKKESIDMVLGEIERIGVQFHEIMYAEAEK